MNTVYVFALFQADLSDDIRIDRTLVTAYEGGSASFVCSPPAGVPSPTVRWKTDGSLLTQNQHVSLSLDNTMLQLDVLMMSDSGIYYCVAENGLGKSVNTSAELRVQRTGSIQSDTHAHTLARLLFNIPAYELLVKL